MNSLPGRGRSAPASTKRSKQNSNGPRMQRSLKWLAVGFALVLLAALLLRSGRTGTVTVTYLQTQTNQNGTTDAWVRIANPGKAPVNYTRVLGEINTNGVWQVVAGVIGGGEVRARSRADCAIPVGTLGVPWRVKVGYRHRTRGVRSIPHRLDELYERVRGKRISVRYETNWHYATSERFVP
jgi:hypothetical protein